MGICSDVITIDPAGIGGSPSQGLLEITQDTLDETEEGLTITETSQNLNIIRLAVGNLYRNHSNNNRDNA